MIETTTQELVHFRKLTWNPKMEIWKLNFLFKGVILLGSMFIFRRVVISSYPNHPGSPRSLPFIDQPGQRRSPPNADRSSRFSALRLLPRRVWGNFFKKPPRMVKKTKMMMMTRMMLSDTDQLWLSFWCLTILDEDHDDDDARWWWRWWWWWWWWWWVVVVVVVMIDDWWSMIYDWWCWVMVFDDDDDDNDDVRFIEYIVHKSKSEKVTSGLNWFHQLICPRTSLRKTRYTSWICFKIDQPLPPFNPLLGFAMKMPGKSYKHIIPNGGVKWWCTMVQSVKYAPQKQIQDFHPQKISFFSVREHLHKEGHDAST